MITGAGTVERVPAPAARRRRGGAARVALVVAVIAMSANFLAESLQSHLREPQAWPTPELQHKFDQIAAFTMKMASRPASGGTVLVGDSLLDAGADPNLITAAPQPVFNASLAGETLPVLASWAAHVVTPRLHPSLVVLGFTANVLNGDIPGEQALVSGYVRSRTVAVAEGRGDWFDQADGWLRAHVALYRDRSVLRDPFDSSSGAGTRIYDPPLSDSGWNEDFRNGRLGSTPQAQAEATSVVHSSLFARFRPSGQKLVEFGALIDQLRREGAQVLVVAMPVSAAALPAAGGSFTYQGTVADLLAAATEHGAAASNAGVWPDEDFADAVHLNAAGTGRFGEWLSSQISTVRLGVPKP